MKAIAYCVGWMTVTRLDRKTFSEQSYDALLVLVRSLKSEVPDDTMLDLLALRETESGQFEVPKYDPLWEIVKRVNMILPLVKLAHAFRPHPDLEQLVHAGELFIALEPAVVFDEPDQCFTDDDEPEHQPDTLRALPFGDQNGREETGQQQQQEGTDVS